MLLRKRSTCFRHALSCSIWPLQPPLEALQRTVITRGVPRVKDAIAEVLWGPGRSHYQLQALSLRLRRTGDRADDCNCTLHAEKNDKAQTSFRCRRVACPCHSIPAAGRAVGRMLKSTNRTRTTPTSPNWSRQRQGSPAQDTATTKSKREDHRRRATGKAYISGWS
jgi:hypothetical protein